eukprot:TRINITY_DN1034_c0_g1_i2.p1 TRINITY_DN1034_c0_g1~~TRINITY_DN1034_c0_g1_i2.p1  ORF type:complete len:952 (+),score=234.06 TRINITY_DN1034_c0_g1_i2:1474-4329(+)
MRRLKRALRPQAAVSKQQRSSPAQRKGAGSRVTPRRRRRVGAGSSPPAAAAAAPSSSTAVASGSSPAAADVGPSDRSSPQAQQQPLPGPSGNGSSLASLRQAAATRLRSVFERLRSTGASPNAAAADALRELAGCSASTAEDDEQETKKAATEEEEDATVAAASASAEKKVSSALLPPTSWGTMAMGSAVVQCEEEAALEEEEVLPAEHEQAQVEEVEKDDREAEARSRPAKRARTGSAKDVRSDVPGSSEASAGSIAGNAEPQQPLLSSSKRGKAKTEDRIVIPFETPEQALVAQQQDGTAASSSASRKSSRQRMRPLEHWRNEQVLYERRSGSLLPTVAAVMVAPKDASATALAKQKSPAKPKASASKQVKDKNDQSKAQRKPKAKAKSKAEKPEAEAHVQAKAKANAKAPAKSTAKAKGKLKPKEKAKAKLKEQTEADVSDEKETNETIFGDTEHAPMLVQADDSGVLEEIMADLAELSATCKAETSTTSKAKAKAATRSKGKEAGAEERAIKKVEATPSGDARDDTSPLERSSPKKQKTEPSAAMAPHQNFTAPSWTRAITQGGDASQPPIPLPRARSSSTGRASKPASASRMPPLLDLLPPLPSSYSSFRLWDSGSRADKPAKPTSLSKQGPTRASMEAALTVPAGSEPQGSRSPVRAQRLGWNDLPVHSPPREILGKPTKQRSASAGPAAARRAASERPKTLEATNPLPRESQPLAATTATAAAKDLPRSSLAANPMPITPRKPTVKKTIAKNPTRSAVAVAQPRGRPATRAAAAVSASERAPASVVRSPLPEPSRQPTGRAAKKCVAPVAAPMTAAERAAAAVARPSPASVAGPAAGKQSSQSRAKQHSLPGASKQLKPSPAKLPAPSQVKPAAGFAAAKVLAPSHTKLASFFPPKGGMGLLGAIEAARVRPLYPHATPAGPAVATTVAAVPSGTAGSRKRRRA